jgi:hypothetical protein
MRMLRKLSAVVLVATVAACSDSTGPNGNTLTQQEKQALVSALASTTYGSLAAIVVQQVGQIGSLSAAGAASAQVSQAIDKALSMGVANVAGSAYEGAVGIAIEATEDYQGTVTTGWFYGVVGWNGINATAGTVNELVFVGGVGDTSTLPASASGTVESGDVFALYENLGTQYTGTTGTASASGSFTGSSTDCSASGTGYSYTCSVVTGTMNTNFAFNAVDASQNAYAQSAVNGSALPSVKMSLNITYSTPNAARIRLP